jgi:uncharacterized membrane protein YeaQ/YmgE (transglycosylase-associated protein family)
VLQFQRNSLDDRRKSIHAWQDRVRDPSLGVLLVTQLCLIFVAAPLAAKGLPIARPIVETLALAVLALVVVLSHRRGAIVTIVLGLIATFAGRLLGPEWAWVAASFLRHGGNIVTFSALTWVVLHAVYAPGHITFHRLQGAVVLYLNVAVMCASAFSLIWALSPTAFHPRCVDGWPRRIRDDALFQPDDLDHDRLRRHRAGRPARPQLGQFGVGYRTVLSRHHCRSPRDARNGTPAPLTSNC